MMTDVLKRKLESDNYKVLVAKDGAEGLTKALGKHPDLILLDIILPVMDGVTFLGKLREDDWGKKVPVIVLSNLSRAAIVAKSKEKGASDYLVKTDWKLSDVMKKIKNELS